MNPSISASLNDVAPASEVAASDAGAVLIAMGGVAVSVAIASEVAASFVAFSVGALPEQF